MWTLPIFIASIRSHIGSVDLDAHRLADEIDREHQAGMRALAHQPAKHALQRTVRHLHHHPLVNQRTGIELEIALHQPADRVDLLLGNRDDIAVERDDVDDAGALEHREPLSGVETGETVAWEQRPVDLLLAILP